MSAYLDRQYDLTVFGASGFTGARVVKYIVDLQCARRDGDLVGDLRAGAFGASD